AWPASMIPAKSSPTHTRDTAARKSANERFSQEKTPDLAKRALQTGSRVPRLNRRRQSCHPRQPQLRRKEPETMADNELRIEEIPQGLVVSGVTLDKGVVTKAAAFVTCQPEGKWGMATTTGGQPARTHDKIAHPAS